jgi:hypothetical protein
MLAEQKAKMMFDAMVETEIKKLAEKKAREMFDAMVKEASQHPRFVASETSTNGVPTWMYLLKRYEPSPKGAHYHGTRKTPEHLKPIFASYKKYCGRCIYSDFCTRPCGAGGQVIINQSDLEVKANV